MSDTQGKEEQVLTKFLQDRKVLIVDGSASSRSGLLKLIHDLGAKTSNVALVNTFDQAQSYITSSKPHLVFTEYDLEKRCGLELLQTQREQRPQETKECIFFVVTSNTSQTAVAKAAEEDIDAYILKPYTVASLRRTILQAVFKKLRPPEYLASIEQAKRLMAEGKLEESDAELQRAQTLDPAPSLALYYRGKIDFMRKLIDDSRQKYELGLGYNRIHFKCMMGLFELLMEQKRYPEAYQAVKRITQYFPANPKRLTEVLRLAVLTGQYADIERYYAMFTSIEERDENLIRYVCAALVICGKHYLSQNSSSRALELFKKAAATGQGRVNVLREIVFALIGAGLTKDVPPFMDLYPVETRESDEYLLLKVMIADAEGQVPFVINQGRALLNRGVGDLRLFEILIRRASEAGLTPVAINDIVGRALARFPDKKDYIDSLLPKKGP